MLAFRKTGWCCMIPDNSDPNIGRYDKFFQKEFDLVKELLKKENGRLFWAYEDYVAFIFSTPTVCILFYPHKTNSGKRVLYMRDQNSKDKKLAYEILKKLPFRMKMKTGR